MLGLYIVQEGANRPPLDIAMNEKMGEEVISRGLCAREGT